MPSFRTLSPEDLSTAALHGHLLSAIAPRPIAFASTISKDGQVNLSPFSFFNVFGANPPIVVFSPARSVRSNTNKDTLNNVQEVPEVVINVVNYPIVEQMSLSSTAYPPDVNEFEKAGLTALASDLVRPPRVAESPASFECEVLQIIETGPDGGAGNLIVAKVVRLHLREDYLDENGRLDIPKLDLVARMGGSYYCRASGDALFEIPKPIATLGIGVDQLPAHVKDSPVLTGNNLGRLGNEERLPGLQEIADAKQMAEVKTILLQHNGQAEQQKLALHHLAKNLIEESNTSLALAVLGII